MLTVWIIIDMHTRGTSHLFALPACTLYYKLNTGNGDRESEEHIHIQLKRTLIATCILPNRQLPTVSTRHGKGVIALVIARDAMKTKMRGNRTQHWFGYGSPLFAAYWVLAAFGMEASVTIDGPLFQSITQFIMCGFRCICICHSFSFNICFAVLFPSYSFIYLLI